MKYLLYSSDGFLKKFPLQNDHITIGRDETNDLVIDNTFISRKHVDIHVSPDAILVQDAGSANGILVGNKRVKQAELKNGDSFKAGEITFLLQSGDTAEFDLSALFSPDFIAKEKEKDSQKHQPSTKTVGTMYKEIESDLLHKGLHSNNFNEFVSYLSLKLRQIPGFGAFFLVEKKGGQINIHLSLNADTEILQHFKEILAKNSSLFQERISLGKPFPGDTEPFPRFCAEPLHLGSHPGSMIYFPMQNQVDRLVGLDTFFIALAKVIELLYGVIAKKEEIPPKKTQEPQEEIEIITTNEAMKTLIQQARKIANSDVFVLIEGESGTGKELFARLLHRFSRREQDKFVALNCAAIPENLLESELFGYEKGAFTGAYTQKKGKLELASAGTLVLDEIGDMPPNLQAKLLRALQEHEFYRLGGTVPIKVNLRIISLTHQNLEELIKEKKFREDLYYRLVHRALTIPPLRERREDIPALINHFSNTFCRQRNRSVSGYSVKAFDALVNFNWNGNVRELENEINSIINLTDDGERVDFDILSEKIKKYYESAEKPLPSAQAPQPPRAPGYNLKPERETIVEVLEKHNWNKSRAARALNMTYHGLHKKMKKMGIT